MAYNDPGGDGVGGWLALFAVIMGLFTPLRVIATTYSSLYGDPAVAAAYGEVWGTLQIFEWSLVALLIAAGWYIVWRLFTVQVWNTVRIAIAGIWIIGIGSIVVDTLGVSLIAGIPIGGLIAGMGPDLVRPIIFGAIWTAYFMFSKRVANTYPRHGDAEEVAQVFG